MSGLPKWLSGKESACQCWGHRFDPWVRRIPWKRKWKPSPGFLPGKPQGQWSLVGYSPWSHKESDMTEQLTVSLSLDLEHPKEKKANYHCWALFKLALMGQWCCFSGCFFLRLMGFSSLVRCKWMKGI